MDSFLFINFDYHVSTAASKEAEMERRRSKSSSSSVPTLPVIMEKVTAPTHRGQRIPSRFGTSYFLSREDVDYLKRNTNYSAKDIKIWFRY